ncbi:DUF982 domain-containing protein [Pelagibacterium sp. H642]|uniref:DUF982 domain-containing protein n=1 Tax=Pelagibacterium sp. H642 TaxID=1881069 RepID=UPI002815910E|nr:DUF982 domain-containing protein [Pelagibacterium sp. H642]WMT90123.1 DUF982 domain-containing protein [Pelagibacterium sp. H642]
MLDIIYKWSRPVTIMLNDTTQEVTGPSQARTILLQDWPGERTNLHKIASDTCQAAIEGANPEPSYLAFIEAAIEAGVFVE